MNPDTAFGYSIGDRIQLIRMKNDPCPLPPGVTGIVTGFCTTHGLEQIQVQWEDPSHRLNLVPGTDHIRPIHRSDFSAAPYFEEIDSEWFVTCSHRSCRKFMRAGQQWEVWDAWCEHARNLHPHEDRYCKSCGIKLPAGGYGWCSRSCHMADEPGAYYEDNDVYDYENEEN